ncbi:50S ribosomal protein L11 methyltransferase [Mesonia ostreae]|uniref:Ribosomal protein L11 methyltransferase n=1 Tax=Mesonia ostreae TaxID=861110 RepID=A0ABU2KEW0_9FLAO|nr:50S ribosomal protein L11 methyltransferase [Mesonia ostreae]MDT0293251.1 50S ribosomal protein L11 methyltransferase [Mesonia ostreae]
MTPVYIGYFFKIEPLQPASDILIAELGEIGFDSFVETEDGIEAYIIKDNHEEALVKEIDILENDNFKISYKLQEFEQVNWNEEWENNFSPIMVDNICQVRAPFHPKKDTKYDIVIEPKMSFGTGHHATTHMMIQHILKDDMRHKSVLDMGCGTGILAILAAMKGAEPVEAIDIDNWCYLNTLENVERNNCKTIKVEEGDAALLMERTYDMIIANINRNILLNDLPTYANCLTENGEIYLSGFYEEDLEIITDKCKDLGLNFDNHLVRENWTAAKFVK